MFQTMASEVPVELTLTSSAHFTLPSLL